MIHQRHMFEYEPILYRAHSKCSFEIGHFMSIKLAIDIFFFVVLFQLFNCGLQEIVKKKSCSKIGSFLLNFAIN